MTNNYLMKAMRGAPFLIPPAFLILVLWLQPADRLGPAPEPEWLGRLLYDDFDVAAMALRGVNAQLGRSAGRVDIPEGSSAALFQDDLNDRQRPYEPTYYLEYPHACLMLFRLGYVWQRDFVAPPASVCDGFYHDIVWYAPQSEHERAIWRQFRRATQTYVVIFVLCQLALMAVLWKGYEPGAGPGPIWLCVLPAAMYFTLNRFDIVPALLCALSLLALGHKRVATSAALLAAATAIKVYPVLLAPLVVRYLWDRREAFARWAAAYTVTLAVFFLPVLAFSGWESFWGPYQFQLNRDPMGPTLYGSILPYSWAGNGLGPKVFRLGTVLASTAFLLMAPMHDMESLLRRSVIALVVFVALPVFFSPQWVLWFLPLLVPLARGRPCLQAATATLDLVTYLSFPIAWDHALPEYFGWLSLRAAVTARFVVLGVLLVILAQAEIRDFLSGKNEPVPEPA